MSDMKKKSADNLQGVPRKKTPPQDNLADRIRRRVEPLGGIELELPPRGPIRAPPDFK